MKKDEIVKQYRLIRVFRPILRFLEISTKWFVLPFLVFVILYVTILPHVLLFVIYSFYALCIFSFFLQVQELDIDTPLTDRFLRYYEKKWGMNKKQIKDYIAKREVFEKESISYILPLLHQLFKLNVNGRDEQESFLSDRFSEDEIWQVFDTDVSASRFEETINYWEKKDLSQRKPLMELLFKFTILDDGIHNDEWKMLMQIMAQLKFNSRYIEYFKDRYYSLRTEFDDYERKSTSSLGEYSTVSLESYYAVLGVEKDASIEEIKRAYHELAMQHHPDLPKNANRKEECEAKMMEINEAYEKVRG